MTPKESECNGEWGGVNIKKSNMSCVITYGRPQTETKEKSDFIFRIENQFPQQNNKGKGKKTTNIGKSRSFPFFPFKDGNVIFFLLFLPSSGVEII